MRAAPGFVGELRVVSRFDHFAAMPAHTEFISFNFLICRTTVSPAPAAHLDEG